MTADKLITIIRDLVCLGLGTFGFAWQVTHGAEIVLMSGCIVVISGPAVMKAWAQGWRTPDSQSSPASPPSSPLPPSPSPSSPAGGDPR